MQKHESDEKPRVWKHQKSGEKVKVEAFSNGTWDTFRGDKLISNHDSPEEAIERCKEIVGQS